MHNNIDNLLNIFNKLPFDEKYQKVLVMLEILKDGDNFFQDFYELLVNLKEETSEELLVNIYTMIETAIIALENDSLNKNLNNLSKTKKKLEKLRKLEELEKQKQDPDNLLKNL